MKYLIKFNESNEESIDIIKSINDLKYIIEDEGYQISTHKSGIASNRGLIHLRIYKKCNKLDFISPEVEEFIDRLKEDVTENKLYYMLPYTHTNGTYTLPTKVFTSSYHSKLNGSLYMDIYFKKYIR